MIDPAAGGGGSFADLSIHLLQLLDLHCPGETVISESLDLQTAQDGVSNSGGRAVLRVSDRRIVVTVSSEQDVGFVAEAHDTANSWVVHNGELSRNDEGVVRGPGPDAATAVRAFLDDVTETPTQLRATTAAEALIAQETLSRILGHHE